MNDANDIRDEVERERLNSRFKDRCSGRRIHPIDNDISRLLDFVSTRRLRQPGVMDLMRRRFKSVDTEAIRLLVDMVLHRGSYGRIMRRRCARLLDYCDLLDDAAGRLAEWKETR